MAKSVVVTIRLSKEADAEAKRWAAAENRSKSGLIAHVFEEAAARRIVSKKGKQA